MWLNLRISVRSDLNEKDIEGNFFLRLKTDILVWELGMVVRGCLQQTLEADVVASAVHGIKFSNV